VSPGFNIRSLLILILNAPMSFLMWPFSPAQI